MKANYKIERTCSNCGNREHINVTKREAAFELVDINNVLGIKCEKCQKDKFFVCFETVDLDFELLKEWSTNIELHIMPQDEELLLADGKYVDYILEILDNFSIHDHKRNLLLDALCVIVYDNSVNENSNKDEELKNRIIGELIKRKEKLKQADDWIMDYIKEVVYPQLEQREK